MGIAGSVAGCVGLLERDTDNDGVPDGDDYAPRDPAVQERSDVVADTASPARTPTNSGRTALSLEEGTVGSSSMPDPWQVLATSGTASIVDRSSDGSKGLRLVSEESLDPVAVGVDVDLTDVAVVLADMYPVDVSPSYGFVKFLLDRADRSNGHIHTREHPGRTCHGGQHTEAFCDGEWHHDVEFYRHTGSSRDLSGIAGTHTLVLHASGDNDVVWDNVRFRDDGGDTLPLSRVLA